MRILLRKLFRVSSGWALLLALTLPLAVVVAGKKDTQKKPAAARVIYSGNFQGHVEPCG
jgi:hypothetical protein